MIIAASSKTLHINILYIIEHQTRCILIIEKKNEQYFLRDIKRNYFKIINVIVDSSLRIILFNGCLKKNSLIVTIFKLSVHP